MDHSEIEHRSCTSTLAEETWKSTIPVHLVLGEGEWSSLEPPPSLYILVPWKSYLHTLLEDALPFFRHMLPHVSPLTPWFAYGTLPLKFQIPVGVLYDILVPEHAPPWKITLSFRNYPSAVLPPYVDEATPKKALRNSLKEAAYICCGMSGTQRVQEMTLGAQDDFWKSIVKADRCLYNSILESLNLVPTSVRGKRKAIPVRIFFVEKRPPGRYLSSYGGIHSLSIPLPVENEDGSPVTVREALLHGGIPGFHTSRDTGSHAQPFEEHSMKVLVAGISPLLDTPVLYLHQHACCADHFLYIVIHAL